MSKVDIYTDGACSQIDNSGKGPGGWCAVLVYGDSKKVHSGMHLSDTTNQRMEILAAIMGLYELKRPCKVVVHSDSQYLVKTMKGEYKRKSNLDLWAELDDAASKHSVEWEWVKGHANDPQNSHADRAAAAMAQQARQERLKGERNRTGADSIEVLHSGREGEQAGPLGESESGGLNVTRLKRKGEEWAGTEGIPLYRSDDSSGMGQPVSYIGVGTRRSYRINFLNRKISGLTFAVDTFQEAMNMLESVRKLNPDDKLALYAYPFNYRFDEERVRFIDEGRRVKMVGQK